MRHFWGRNEVLKDEGMVRLTNEDMGIRSESQVSTLEPIYKTDTIPVIDKPKRRRALGLRLFAQVCLSVSLLGLMFWMTDLQTLLDTVRNVHFGFFIAGIFLYSGGMVLSAYRWQRLLAAKAIHVSLVRLLFFYLQGMFCNRFLPTSVGGDLLRSYAIYRVSQGQEASVVSVFVERLLGTAAMLILVAIGLFVGDQLLIHPLVIVLSIAVIVLFVVMVRLFVVRNRSLLRGVCLGEGLLSWLLIKLRGLASHYVGLPGALLEGLLLSMLIQIRIVIIYFLLAQGFDLNIPFSVFLCFVPTISLLSMLPISLGGLGVREGLTILLFGKVGVPVVSSVSLSLAFLAITLLSSCLGVPAFILDRYYRH